MIAGITEMKTGKSSPLILNLIVFLISSKYHPEVSPKKSGCNFPSLYKI
jgi:hypothetical protein